MGDPPKKERQSTPVRTERLPPLTEEAKARQEALNTLLQYDRMAELIDQTLNDSRNFRLRPSTIQDLNRISIQRIELDAGRWRDVPMRIEQSQHNPPPPEEVPRYIDEMCEHINDNWDSKSALYLAAYVMWRLNWIHPFVDGNGRTTRAISYYILCAKLGFRIPGVTTIPELVAKNKAPYYGALEVADAAYATGKINVEAMESLLKDLLAAQMVEAIERADSGGKASDRRKSASVDNALPTNSADPISRETPFSVKIGAVFGAITLLFFMALILLQIGGYTLPGMQNILLS